MAGTGSASGGAVWEDTIEEKADSASSSNKRMAHCTKDGGVSLAPSRPEWNNSRFWEAPHDSALPISSPTRADHVGDHLVRPVRGDCPGATRCRERRLGTYACAGTEGG